MPAAGAALPTSDTISWVGSRARPSLDFPLGCRLPCRSLDPYHASQCQMVLQGAATLHEGPARGRKRDGKRVGAKWFDGCRSCHSGGFPPSLTSAGVAGRCLGIPRRTKTSTVETLICGEDISKICLYISYLHTHYYHNDT